MASDLCGTTVLTNLTLDHDLTCSGNGLLVGADGITVNLNGHTITGPGSGVGISISNRTGVVIVGGTVKNFLAGVQLVNSTAIVVEENRFTGNQDAVFLIGSKRTSWKATARMLVSSWTPDPPPEDTAETAWRPALGGNGTEMLQFG